MNNTLTLDVENFVTNALQAVIPMGPLADALENYADESIEDDEEKHRRGNGFPFPRRRGYLLRTQGFPWQRVNSGW